MVVNFQSLKDKGAELKTCLEFDNPDVLIGTETWLKSSINSSELFPSSYNVFRKDRPITNKQGMAYGGILIATKCELVCVNRPDLDSLECEMMWVELKITGAKPVLVGSFYRPPKSDLEYLTMLRESLTRIDFNRYSNIWLGGDFNLAGVDWPMQCVRPGADKAPICREPIDLANDYGLEQMVEKPTRKNNS